MTDRTLVTTSMACNLFSLQVLLTENTMEVTAQSLGYEIDEEELADELRSETCADCLDQPAPQIEPEEFETIYTIFLS